MRKKRAFCKCTILCYILEYIYIVQIEKRHTRTVLAFNMQNTTKDSSVFYLIAYLHVERKQDLCVSLLFVQYRYTSICNTKKSTFTRQNTFYFTILEIVPMYTLVSEGHVTMFKCYLNSTAVNKVRVAKLVEHQTSDLRVVGSSSP